jgi:hypothetical protein
MLNGEITASHCAILLKMHHSGLLVQSQGFSIVHDAPVTTTGWQGLPLPANAHKKIVERFKSSISSGSLLDVHTVSAEKKERSAFIFDSFKRIILARTARQLWMLKDGNANALGVAILDLLGHELTNLSLRMKCAGLPPSWAALSMHHRYQRQYTEVCPVPFARTCCSDFQKSPQLAV